MKEFHIGLFPKHLEKSYFHARLERHRKNKGNINCVSDNQNKTRKYELNKISSI